MTGDLTEKESSEISYNDDYISARGTGLIIYFHARIDADGTTYLQASDHLATLVFIQIL